MTAPHFITSPLDGARLATLLEDGIGPTLVWLGGYRSEMTGSKGDALAAFARGTGRRLLRFDYFGHGLSDGHFSKGTISRWLNDSLTVINEIAPGPILLLGSSMGGWLALLVARHLQATGRGADLTGLILIAPAPDFTEELILPGFSAEQKKTLEDAGELRFPSDYGSENIFPLALFEDGRRHLVLGQAIAIGAPVHILHGRADDVVPLPHVLRLLDRLIFDDVTLTLVPDGDHRLSRPEDLDLLIATVRRMLKLA